MKKLSFLLYLFWAGFVLCGQNTQETADAFLTRVSQNYAKIKDYRARVTISKNGATQVGTLYYIAPDRLKIQYIKPDKQVLLITKDLLQLYVPQYEAVMEQKLSHAKLDDVGGLGVGRGLEILQKNYSVTYVKNARPQPLEPGSNEMVIKLQFHWRVNNEGFRNLEMSLNPQTLLIRRVVGVTSLFETVQFDFTSIRTDSNISKTIFTLEVPDTSRVTRFPDFIYGAEAR